MGDFFTEVLSSPWKGVSLVLLVSLLLGLGLLGTMGLLYVFHIDTSEVEFGEEGSHIILKITQHGVEEFIILVAPQEWQDSGISIKRGDHIEFHAGGRVCIDVENIVRVSQARQGYENALLSRHPKLESSEKDAPEDFFTENEKKKLKLDHPWATPDGFDLKQYTPRWKARGYRYLFPNKGAGGLVAAIHTNATKPDKSEAFFVGSSHYEPAGNDGVPTDGNLWFTINDVQSNDPTIPDLFYYDNVGSFWVKVTVIHPKKGIWTF